MSDKRVHTSDKAAERARGLYRNGSRWWLRVRGEPRSTGTTDLRLANRIAGMVAEMEEQRVHHEWLARVVARGVTLETLYRHWSSQSLAELRNGLQQAAVLNLEPLVERWATEYLPLTAASAATAADYVRQVRALLPEGEPCPVTDWTAERAQRALLALDCTSSTRRRYVAAWRLFAKYARRVAGAPNPFLEMEEWMPENRPAREVWWPHERVIEVLEHIEPHQRLYVALLFATGMDTSELETLTYGDINWSDGRLFAKGTKNEYRERWVTVDRWAWQVFLWERDRMREVAPPQRKVLESDCPIAALRAAFYAAQVSAGLVQEPPKSANGKPLWGQVAGLHRLKDCRHTYAVTRLCGLDGEPKRSMKWVSLQLGHADEQMLQRVYARIARKDRALLAALEAA